MIEKDIAISSLGVIGLLLCGVVFLFAHLYFRERLRTFKFSERIRRLETAVHVRALETEKERDYWFSRYLERVQEMNARKTNDR